MAERTGPRQEGPRDPLQRAVEAFNRRAAAPRYPGGDALKRALDNIQKAGTRVNMTPGELYARMAEFSAAAAEVAEQHGQEADAQTFTSQQESLLVARDQLVVPETGLILPSDSPSNPQRTTGRASG